MNNPALAARVQQALALVHSGQIVDARRISDALLAEAGRDPDALYLAGEVACAEERWDESLDHFRAAASVAQVAWPLDLRMAELLLFLRRRDDARLALRSACDHAGENPQAWALAGRAYNKCGETALARDCLQRAVDLQPHNPGAWFELASAQFFLGDTQAAMHALEQVMPVAGSDGPLAGHARYLRATLQQQTPQSNHVDVLERELATGFRDAEGRSAACYALAKELEDLGRSQDSARALAEGAALRKSILNPDVSSEVETMAAIAQVWSEVQEDAGARHFASDDDGPIFVVGLPRTGTTLTERILMRDPRVVAAGELLDLPQLVGNAVQDAIRIRPGIAPVQASLELDFPALGREYLRGAREAAHGSAMFIDKLPVNFLYIGIIARALPNARIVHVVRDPLDAAWAIHKTLFASAYHWSCDLDQVADYIVAYHRLMRHWHAVLPGRILDVRYEDLVSDPESQSRRLLAGCGLVASMDPDATTDARSVVTASAAQVRQPIHSRSIGRWQDHADRLAAVAARFRAAGLID